MMVGVTHPPSDAPKRPGLSRRTLLASAVGVSALAAGALVLFDSDDGPTGPTGQTRRIAQDKRSKAPEVKGTLLTGEAYDLTSATAGKVVVLNFWGQWCIPCRTEAPDLEAVYQQSRAQGVEFVGITVRDQVDPAKAFAAARFSYPSVHDPDGRIALRFADRPVNSTPATLILDRQGRVASVTLGQIISKDQLQVLVDEVLAEAPSAVVASGAAPPAGTPSAATPPAATPGSGSVG